MNFKIFNVNWELRQWPRARGKRTYERTCYIGKHSELSIEIGAFGHDDRKVM
jgi:hypothetical protein